MQKLTRFVSSIPVNQILALLVGMSILLTSFRIHEAHVSAVSRFDAINAPPVVVDLNSVVNIGSGSIAEASVTLVNPRPDAVRVCAIGVLKKNSASSVRVVSLPMCGTVGAFETKTIKAPWTGGRASDVCVGDGGSFSWDACSYDLVNYKP